MINTIDCFIKDRNIAIIGVSKDPNKFGNILLKELSKKGYVVYPVHPHLTQVEEVKCYQSLNSLPESVTNLLLVVKPEVTEEIVSSINPKKIQRVWMHKGMGNGSASPKAIEKARNKGIQVVYGFCPMMFMAPSGFHRFHYWMRKTFGTTPPEFQQSLKRIKELKN